MFRVPKQRTSVDVLHADGTWRKCAVFLATLCSHHDGPERVSDLFAGDQQFLAAHDEQSGAMTLLGCANVACVRVEPWAEMTDVAGEQPVDHAVAVTLLGGTTLQGVLSFAARADQARVIDHLNGPGTFFALQETAAVALVNKRHVVRVELR